MKRWGETRASYRLLVRPRFLGELIQYILQHVRFFKDNNTTSHRTAITI